MVVVMVEPPQDVGIFASFSERESDGETAHTVASEAINSHADESPKTLTLKLSAIDTDGEDGTNALAGREPACRDHRDAEAEEHCGPLETSLQRMLQVWCFSGFDGKSTTYLYTTQLTHSNVVSTVVTSRPFNLKRRQNFLLSLDNNNGNNNNDYSDPSKFAERKKQLGGSRNQDLHSMHVYSQPCNPKKVRNQQKGKYQAQLPTFRRSLPSLPIPVNRLNQELIQERDKFMAQLHKERAEKNLLENWAATKIQACYRGYRGRPRIVTYQIRQQLNSLRAIRLDLSDMRESLKKAEESAGAVDNNPGSQQVSLWRKDVSERAGKKHDVRTRKERIYSAATLIQACVKRFLARFGYVHLIARHYDEARLKAIVRVQSVYRGFRLRNRIHRVVAKLQLQAVLQIQSLIRGIQARERACILRFEQKSERRRLAREPLQFTLPSRTRPVAATSSLRSLYEHRKTRAKLEFKSAKWKEEQMYLRIHRYWSDAFGFILTLSPSVALVESGREALYQPEHPTPPASRRSALDPEQAQVTGVLGAKECAIGRETATEWQCARSQDPLAVFTETRAGASLVLVLVSLFHPGDAFNNSGLASSTEH